MIAPVYCITVVIYMFLLHYSVISLILFLAYQCKVRPPVVPNSDYIVKFYPISSNRNVLQNVSPATVSKIFCSPNACMSEFSGSCNAAILPVFSISVGSQSEGKNSWSENIILQADSSRTAAIVPTSKLPCTVNSSGDRILSDLLESKCSKVENLTIMFHNICHIVPKIDEIRILLSDRNAPSIACFCETFLTDTVPDSFLSVSSYSLYRRDRSGRAGGGIVIYVSDVVTSTVRSDLENENIEGLWLDVQYKKFKKTLGVIYRPPSSVTAWFDQFATVLEEPTLLDKDTIILGDFNIDLLQNLYEKNKLVQLTESFGLTQVIKEPTRITDQSATLIDHVYLSDTLSSAKTEAFVLDIGMSDHHPVMVILKADKRLKSGKHNQIEYRDFKHMNNSAFLQDLQLTNWDDIFETYDPNIAVGHLQDTLIRLTDMHAPTKLKRVKTGSRPKWLTNEIPSCIHYRNKLKKRSNKLEYTIARKRTKRLIKKAKEVHYKNLVNQNKHNPRNVWKLLRELKDPGKDKKPFQLKIDNITVTDPKTIANHFNSHFSNIARISAGIRSPSIIGLPSNRSNFEDFVIPRISETKVSKMINDLSPNKASGLDNIGANILKTAATVINSQITRICNLSIDTGKFPDAWKQAKIKPLHKSGSREEAKNYRPVSILPIMSKILERHVHDNLTKYLDEKDILTRFQSGFRKHHSCQTTLTYITDKWYSAINNNQLVGAVFLDLSKAFDLVPHSTLLNKLQQFKCSSQALEWFHSYLSGRTQRVVVSSELSDSTSINLGVPQGSILGPLLFKIFIDDLQRLPQNSDADLYADDCTLTAVASTVSELQHKLNSDLKLIQIWCDINGMKINTTKTTCMLITTKQKRASLGCSARLTLSLHDKILQNVQTQKLLGVLIDNNLTWKDYANVVIRKLNSNLFVFNKLKVFLDKYSKLTFHNAYIKPHLNYCCNIWGKCPKASRIAIDRQVKRSMRIILNKDLSHSSTDLYTELKWFPFEFHMQYQIALLIYKAFNHEAPSYISDLLLPVNNASLRSFSSANLQTPFVHKEIFKKSFTYSAAEVWNALPCNVKQASSVSLFKRTIRNHYFLLYRTTSQ